ncbi:MAG TPA: hypothetical protein VJB09_02030 [Candidatus Paceibacterota bacterium]
MIEPEKNFRDISLDIKDSSLIGGLPISYNKVNKLITALYIVTDILDSEEPLRSKLRTSGSDILSDIYLLRTTRSNSASYRVIGNILKTVSFLDIASTVGILSEMNCGILRNEFLILKDSVNKALENYAVLSGEVNLRNFFNNNELEQNKTDSRPVERNSNFEIKQPIIPAKRNIDGTRIGVQKGSTLLQAISDKMSQKNVGNSVKDMHNTKENFNVLKNDRRDIILNIIKGKGDGATITDIRTSAYGPLKDIGEKTLQRELVAMVGDGVLKKVGSKRWSRYYPAGN